MKIAFDTSVLVAAVVEEHPQHDVAIGWLRSRKKLELIASWHAMAETWCVLTRLPLDPPVAPAIARAIIDRLAKKLRLIAPAGRIYNAALERCTAHGLRSGSLFDAIHIVTAELEQVDTLLTFNRKDFERMSGPKSPQIVAPSLVDQP